MPTPLCQPLYAYLLYAYIQFDAYFHAWKEAHSMKPRANVADSVRWAELVVSVPCSVCCIFGGRFLPIISKRIVASRWSNPYKPAIFRDIEFASINSITCIAYCRGLRLRLGPAETET